MCYHSQLQPVKTIIKSNWKNWFDYLLQSAVPFCRIGSVMTLEECVGLDAYAVMNLLSQFESMTDVLPMWVSPGRVSGRSSPPPSSGEQRASKSAEETREFFQHICRGVQPKPAASSPWSHGCRVSPSFLKSPKK